MFQIFFQLSKILVSEESSYFLIVPLVNFTADNMYHVVDINENMASAVMAAIIMFGCKIT